MLGKERDEALVFIDMLSGQLKREQVEREEELKRFQNEIYGNTAMQILEVMEEKDKDFKRMTDKSFLVEEGILQIRGTQTETNQAEKQTQSVVKLGKGQLNIVQQLEQGYSLEKLDRESSQEYKESVKLDFEAQIEDLELKIQRDSLVTSYYQKK